MSSHNGTGAYWDETYPKISEPVYKGYLEIQDLRKGLTVRAEYEHETLADSSVGFEHKQGSAKAFSQDAAPTQRPDAATALDADDDGRLWNDENASDVSAAGWFFVWTGGDTWTPIGEMLGGSLLLDNTNPEFTIHSTVQENADNGRESMIIAKGEDSGGTAHELATLRFQHDTTGDDYLGEIIVLANDGSDSDGALTEVLRINTTDGLVMNSKQIVGVADGTAAGEVLNAGQVDDTTIELNGSDQLKVKDGSIGQTQLGAGIQIFGTRTANDSEDDALVEDVVYQVTTDGFLTVGALLNEDRPITIYSDDTDPPTVIVGKEGDYDSTASLCLTVPIIKDDYFKITVLNGSPDYIWWLPFGDGECTPP